MQENGIATTLDSCEVEEAEAQRQSKESEGIADDEKTTSVENYGVGDLDKESQDNAPGTSEVEAVPTMDVNEQDVYAQQQQAPDDVHTLTHKIEVPNSKVRLLNYLCRILVKLHVHLIFPIKAKVVRMTFLPKIVVVSESQSFYLIGK